MIHLRNPLDIFYMAFQIIQGKLGLIENNVSLLLLFERVYQGENIPHPIPDLVLTELIIIGFDGIDDFPSLGIPLDLLDTSYFDHVSYYLVFSLRAFAQT